jgi:hypothetical protein
MVRLGPLSVVWASCWLSVSVCHTWIWHRLSCLLTCHAEDLPQRVVTWRSTSTASSSRHLPNIGSTLMRPSAAWYEKSGNTTGCVKQNFLKMIAFSTNIQEQQTGRPTGPSAGGPTGSNFQQEGGDSHGGGCCSGCVVA